MSDQPASSSSSTVRVHEGYDMDDVDAHLDRVAVELRRRLPGG